MMIPKKLHLITIGIAFVLPMLACSLTSSTMQGEYPPPLTPLPENTNLNIGESKSLVEKTAAPILTTIPSKCPVLSQALHLRACAGVECQVIGWLRQNDSLTILETESGWMRVITPSGQSGWVNAKFCGGE